MGLEKINKIILAIYPTGVYTMFDAINISLLCTTVL